MFCKKCGTEMKDDARFCPKCGYDTQGKVDILKEEKKEDKEVKLQLKPTFKFLYKFLTTLGSAIVWVIIVSLWIFPDFDEVQDAVTFTKTIWGIIAIVFVLYIVIKMIIEKIQYSHYEYNFYNTKVEYIDGFLNKEEKELKYKHIREVALRQNIIQRMFNIGTIRVFTNATSGYKGNNRNLNGLNIHCIENPQEQYKKVKELIDNESAD